MRKPRIVAFYLPQYYPTEENDKWWHPGFTEWTNVAKARPLFRGHYQPKIPADLGFYDLRLSETREKQAELAKFYGIEGFCYWHYWFSGKRLLDIPFKEVLASKNPDFPFCLCWANHSWYKKMWNSDEKGIKDILLIKQDYPGIDDYTNHFNALLPAFKDNRYMKVDGKLIFGIYSPLDIPDLNLFISTWNNLALNNGLNGFYFFGFTYFNNIKEKILETKIDTCVFDYTAWHGSQKISLISLFKRKILKTPHLLSYKKYADFVSNNFDVNQKRTSLCIIPNFDHSPRSSVNGVIYNDSTPIIWRKLLNAVFNKYKAKDGKDNLLFIKAWNEWGEGNYLEPDTKYGKEYLEAIKDELDTL